MTSDVGITKPMFPPPAQTGPTAATGRVEPAADAKEKPTPAEQVQAADEEAESLENVVSDLNQLVRELHRELQFSVDEDSGDTVVKVIDSETDEVLRQIPSEQVMRLRQRLEEAAGVIFQDSA